MPISHSTRTDEIRRVHRDAFDHVASPGSQFTGAQRVELANTVIRALRDDDATPPWVALSADGRLDEWSPPPRGAPDAAHDLAHRIARHAGTVTETVYRATADRIGDLAAVEVCSITSTVAAVVQFARAIGDPVPRVPEPQPGPATGETADRIESADLNWVPVAAPADQVPAVVQAYTALPSEDTNTWRLAAVQYIPIDEMGDPEWRRRTDGLSRPQTELVATRIARHRECFY